LQAIPANKELPLTSIPHLLRSVDLDYSLEKYGFRKLRTALEGVPGINIFEYGDFTPPLYKCILSPVAIPSTDKDTKIAHEVYSPESLSFPEKGKGYTSLFKRHKNQSSDEVFAFFHWKDHWDEPFEKISSMAEDERWGFPSDEDPFFILKTYLNSTFMRCQEQEKIVFSSDGNYACFNSGLLTTDGHDILMHFNKTNSTAENRTAWLFSGPITTLSFEFNSFEKIPLLATFLDNYQDFIFSPEYSTEIDYMHILTHNKERLPLSLQNGGHQLLKHALSGAVENTKKRCFRNHRFCIPHWFNNKIQFLFPLSFSEEGKIDVILVAVPDHVQKSYQMKTILTNRMAYINARVISNMNTEWINEAFSE